MQKSSNPAFKNMEQVIGAQQSTAPSADYLNQMYNQPSYTAAPQERYLTVDDVVMKTAGLLVAAVAAGFVTAWFQLYALAVPAMIVGLVLSMIVIFKRTISPPLIIGYAIAEGILLGAISGWFNTIYPGIAAQAIVGTLGVFAGMLVVYKTGAIRVTPRLTKMIIGGIIGVAVLMLFNLVMSLFGINTGLRDGGALAIGFSILCIALAAFSFLLDFDAIDQAIKQGAPAKTSWYFAFGLMVTLVWLYLEILRLLSYMRD